MIEGKVLQLLFYNDPVLRRRAQEIGEITDEIRQLAADLLATCRNHKGIGLAAPQVGRSVRMFLIDLSDSDVDDGSIKEPLILINPHLSNPSAEVWIHEEGCLSIPGPYEDVVRPRSIFVSAIGIDGKPIEREFSGWEARVVMHENDHINGVLFIDRIDPKTRKKIEPELRAIDKMRKKQDEKKKK